MTQLWLTPLVSAVTTAGGLYWIHCGSDSPVSESRRHATKLEKALVGRFDRYPSFYRIPLVRCTGGHSTLTPRPRAPAQSVEHLRGGLLVCLCRTPLQRGPNHRAG